jgi:serpin B
MITSRRTAAAASRSSSLQAALLALALLASTSTANAQEAPAIKSLTGAYNVSGMQLYRALTQAPGNLVLSPYSIGTALGMAYSGARGETEREMAAVLKLDAPRAQIDAANKMLLQLLAGYDRTSGPGYCPPGFRWTGSRCEAAPGAHGECRFSSVKQGDVCAAAPGLPSASLRVANALVLPKDAPGVTKAYAEALRDSYAAVVLNGAGVDDINAWVAARTAGKIDRIVDSLPPNAGPMLINAVHLKAQWLVPFLEEATIDGDFRISAAAKVRVPMMRQREQLALVERPGYRAVKLDYTAGGLAMLIVLPEAVDGLEAVAGKLDALELGLLGAALQQAQPRLVALNLPRFRAALAADLVEPLRGAGLRLPFSDTADFSGMSDSPRGLKIGSIKHRAVIEVNEQGTEAAAATSIGMVATGAPFEQPQPVPFVVDRPFLFVVADTNSGAVLFHGRIADPSRRE